MSELRLERQCIVCLLEERDDNNEFIIKGIERKYCIEYKQILQQKLISYQKKKIRLFDSKYKSINYI